jgi:predicted N-acetyltransferase YhbS
VPRVRLRLRGRARRPRVLRRFGFRRASDRGIANEYGADEEFMLLGLLPDALPPTGGLARYAPAFAALPA